MINFVSHSYMPFIHHNCNPTGCCRPSQTNKHGCSNVGGPSRSTYLEHRILIVELWSGYLTVHDSRRQGESCTVRCPGSIIHISTGVSYMYVAIRDDL